MGWLGLAAGRRVALDVGIQRPARVAVGRAAVGGFRIARHCGTGRGGGEKGRIGKTEKIQNISTVKYPMIGGTLGFSIFVF